MSHGVDPEQSVIVRFGMLFTGVMILLAGVVAAVQLHWVALILFPFTGLIFWGWWVAGASIRARGRTAGALPSWPEGVPRLYPKLDGVALCEFISADQFEAIKAFPIVSVLPFISQDSSDADAAFGLGLQQLLIRDLMLVPNISVHGSEDTPKIYVETARSRAVQSLRAVYVTGVASVAKTGFRLDLEIHRPDHGWSKGTISDAALEPLLQKCAAAIAKNVGGVVNESVIAKWRVARPSSAASLARFGHILLTLEEDPIAQSQALLELAERDPGFGLPAANIDSDFPGGALPHLLDALRRDPYNANLCFGLFCAVWQSQGWEPAAMQFARRAIELSPGLGKAHMCAPHAAHPDAQMLPHSELGYRLLPGNTFAVNNYVLNLERAGTRPEELIRLAKEGVSNDSRDPGNYERLIDLYCDAKEFGAALVVAESLQELFQPEINERTLYCLKQNPRIAQWLETNRYDPAAENRQRIAKLRALCDG